MITMPSRKTKSCPTWCDVSHDTPPLEGYDPCHVAHVLDVHLSDGWVVVSVEKVGYAPASVWVELPGSLTPQEALTVAAAMNRAAGIAQSS